MRCGHSRSRPKGRLIPARNWGRWRQTNVEVAERVRASSLLPRKADGTKREKVPGRARSNYFLGAKKGRSGAGFACISPAVQDAVSRTKARSRLKSSIQRLLCRFRSWPEKAGTPQDPDCPGWSGGARRPGTAGDPAAELIAPAGRRAQTSRPFMNGEKLANTGAMFAKQDHGWIVRESVHCGASEAIQYFAEGKNKRAGLLVASAPRKNF